MKQKLKKPIVIIVFLACFCHVQGQVTIGKDKSPETFSVLEVSAVDTKGGFRLPHLTTADRNAWRDYLLGTATKNPVDPGQTTGVTAEQQANAPGLAIFNTDTKCYEYWNGSRWVSLCEGNSLMTIGPDPCSGVAADGTGCDNEFAVADPDCSGGPFTFIIVAGGDCATLTDVDKATGTFRIKFEKNNSVRARSVVVRVTSGCTGLYKDFLFTQVGQTCDAALGTAPEITSTPAGKTLSLCAGGAIYLSVPPDTPNLNELIWTRNNVEIARGVNRITAIHAGVYDVWMGIIGCGQKAGNAVTVTKAGTGAPRPVEIVVRGNNGYVCGPSGTTRLIARNPASGTVRWFKNGLLQPVTSPASEINAGIGEWFAVVNDGDCWSTPSTTVVVSEDVNSGASLILPVIESSGSFCAGGSVWLSVNDASYNSSYAYTWYEDNTEIGYGRSFLYTVPSGGQKSVVVRCRATLANSCAAEALEQKTISFGPLPAAPAITGSMALCSGAGTLNAIASGVANPVYRWYKNTRLIHTGQSLDITSGGEYYVTVTENGGCTSTRTYRQIDNVSSAVPAALLAKSTETPHLNDVVTYVASINFGPATSYSWTVVNATLETGGGNTPNAVVKFDKTGAASVKVEVSNICGIGSAIHSISDVQPACADPASVFPSAGTALNIVSGKSVTLGPVSVTFASGSPIASYQWYSNTRDSNSGGTLISGATNNTYVTPADKPAGTYYYYCEVKNASCSSATLTTGVYKVDVTSIPVEVGNGSLSGKACFDVVESNDGGDCGTLLSRDSQKADFSQASANTQVYTFKLTSGSGTALRFYAEEVNDATSSDGTGKILVSQPTETYRTINTSDSYTVTLRFQSDLNSKASGTSPSGSKKSYRLTLYAIFNDGTKDVAVKYNISIQDCACCGAPTSSGGWLTFMCHNLGADTSLNPFTPARGLNGNYYQWGRSKVAATVDSDSAPYYWDGSEDQAATSWNSGTEAVPRKNTVNDPCPAGWRVPTRTEWVSVYTGVTGNWSNAGPFVDDGNFLSGKKVGIGLYLPAAGGRRHIDGSLFERGYSGYYWSSTQSQHNNIYSYYLVFSNSHVLPDYFYSKAYGYSVRCVPE
jgi:uncharacterized protein (TIGR02145 family)